MLAWIGSRLLRFLSGGAPTDNPVRRRHEELTEKARARAEKAGLLYEAYGGKDVRRPRLRLVVIGRGVWQPVDLDGYGFGQINLSSPRWRRDLLGRLQDAQDRAKRQWSDKAGEPWEARHEP